MSALRRSRTLERWNAGKEGGTLERCRGALCGSSPRLSKRMLNPKPELRRCVGPNRLGHVEADHGAFDEADPGDARAEAHAAGVGDGALGVAPHPHVAGALERKARLAPCTITEVLPAPMDALHFVERPPVPGQIPPRFAQDRDQPPWRGRPRRGSPA